MKSKKVIQKNKCFKFNYIDISKVRRKQELYNFIIWSALPKEERNPRTQKEFANFFGLSTDTLTSWKKLNGFYDEVFPYTINYFRKWTPRIAHGLAMKASTGSAREVELYFKIFEKFTETVQIKEDPITPKQVAQMEERMNNWDRKRKEKAGLNE